MDPNNLFDLSKLNDDELGQLEFVLNSPAFEGVFKPYLLGVIRGIERLMKDRSDARKAQYNDDFLAGQCLALEGFLAFAAGIIQSTNMARMAAAVQMTPNEEYERLRSLGLVRGAGQVVRPEDLTPFEEF